MMDKTEFIEKRKTLGKTQSQLARILCLSTKTIQSFEQGWRNIPVHVEREILLLEMLKQNSEGNQPQRACWEMTGCPAGWRKSCIVGELGVKGLCWYLNGTFCRGEYHRNWEEKIAVCRECEVFRSTFSGEK